MSLGRKEEEMEGKGRNGSPPIKMVHECFTRFLLRIQEPRIFNTACITWHCESGISSG